MTVKELLQNKCCTLYTIDQQSTIVKAMEHLIHNQISCLPIIKDKHLIGIISDKDIFRAIFENQSYFDELTVGDFMESNVIIGVAEDNIEYIANLMTKNRIRHIPIVEKNTLIGLVSIGDIVKAKEKNIQFENRYLK
ncbi:MAG TPA: CBS domain-containing protein, partial [candidate division Zixibacteria bacterium]|nr:CBS domain-containing protein [candidate division Zixibacteria bacterium]